MSCEFTITFGTDLELNGESVGLTATFSEYDCYFQLTEGAGYIHRINYWHEDELFKKSTIDAIKYLAHQLRYLRPSYTGLDSDKKVKEYAKWIDKKLSSWSGYYGKTGTFEHNIDVIECYACGGKSKIKCNYHDEVGGKSTDYQFVCECGNCGDVSCQMQLAVGSWDQINNRDIL